VVLAPGSRVNGSDLGHAQSAGTPKHKDEYDAVEQSHRPARGDGYDERCSDRRPAVADVPSQADDPQKPNISLCW